MSHPYLRHRLRGDLPAPEAEENSICPLVLPATHVTPQLRPSSPVLPYQCMHSPTVIHLHIHRLVGPLTLAGGDCT